MPLTMYHIFKMDIQQYTNSKAWFKITTKAIYYQCTDEQTNYRVATKKSNESHINLIDRRIMTFIIYNLNPSPAHFSQKTFREFFHF